MELEVLGEDVRISLNSFKLYNTSLSVSVLFLFERDEWFFMFFISFFQTHEFDSCRFDVSVNNCVWYLRTESTEDRDNWIEVLQSYNVNLAPVPWCIIFLMFDLTVDSFLLNIQLDVNFKYRCIPVTTPW